MEWEDEVHRGVPGQTSRTAAIFPASTSERVWGVAYEIGREYWDRVLEAKVQAEYTDPNTVPTKYKHGSKLQLIV